MNIPIGSIEEQQKTFSESNPFEKMAALLKSDFSGYLVATVEGVSGLEEGLLLVRDSKVVGAAFSALRVKKQVYGLKALRLSLNCLKAAKGVFDVNRLSRQQIDLILAFNEKIAIPKPLDQAMLSRLEPEKYRHEIVSEELEVDLKGGDTKQKLLKGLGLGGI
jgi:hypothetical protein